MAASMFEESGEHDSLPLCFEQLHNEWDSKDVRGFHNDHFPQGHGPTDCCRWFRESKNHSDGYEVQYKSFYEPYVVVQKNAIPLYDERFTGYGMNKISHIAAMIATKSYESFWVLTNAFLVAEEHPKSQAWQAVYGKQECSEWERFALKARFRRFCGDLCESYEPALSSATSSLLNSLTITDTSKEVVCEVEQDSKFANHDSLASSRARGTGRDCVRAS
jgi:glycosyltransferase-like protein LARGE